MILTQSDAVRIYRMWLPSLRIVTDKLKICSPFRAEREPSFEINLSNGLWYDYGAGEGGDIINFICRMENISIRDGLMRYEEIMNGGMVKPIDAPVMKVYNNNPNKLSIYRVEFLNDIHKWDDGVLGDRGITENVFMQNGGYMWKEGGYQHVLLSFNGSSDTIVDRYKMWIWKNGKKYTYSRGNTTLYPLATLRYKDIVLCEGEFDCLSVLSKGYHAITGTGGAGTFKEEWAWALSKKRICVLYDADAAGDNGAVMVKQMLEGYSKSIYINKWDNKPEHYDVGDYIKEGGCLDGIIRF